MVCARISAVELAVAGGEVVGLDLATAHLLPVKAHGKIRVHRLEQRSFAEARPHIVPKAYLRHGGLSEHLVRVHRMQAIGIGRYFDHLLLRTVCQPSIRKEGKKRRRAAEYLKNMQTAGRSGILINL